MEDKKTTETGIVITDFKQRQEAGLLKLIASPGASVSFMWFEPTWIPAMADGKPVFVEGEPTMKNINRGSLDSLGKQLDAQQATIDSARKDIADILAEMALLDSTS